MHSKQSAVLSEAIAHAQSHLTRTLHLQVSLLACVVVEGSEHAFGQKEEKLGQAAPRSLFLGIPGKLSVAGPDKPRTESVTRKQPADSARPGTPRDRRLHGSSMATLAGSLWSLKQSPYSPYLSAHPSLCLPARPLPPMHPLSSSLPLPLYLFFHLPASVSGPLRSLYLFHLDCGGTARGDSALLRAH